MDFLTRVNELSLLILRMCIQKVDFQKLQKSLLAAMCLNAAVNLLWRKGFRCEPKIKDQIVQKVLQMSKNQLNIDVIEQYSEQIILFYFEFDQWHCGMNQLRNFKDLSFPLH